MTEQSLLTNRWITAKITTSSTNLVDGWNNGLRNFSFITDHRLSSNTSVVCFFVYNCLLLQYIWADAAYRFQKRVFFFLFDFRLTVVVVLYSCVFLIGIILISSLCGFWYPNCYRCFSFSYVLLYILVLSKSVSNVVFVFWDFFFILCTSAWISARVCLFPCANDVFWAQTKRHDPKNGGQIIVILAVVCK
jgi:hypothetical protein